jgi:hypothetical protein
MRIEIVCSLDSRGAMQGGPEYFLDEGRNTKREPDMALALAGCVAPIFGCMAGLVTRLRGLNTDRLWLRRVAHDVCSASGDCEYFGKAGVRESVLG